MPIIIVQGSKSHPKRKISRNHEALANQDRQKATTASDLSNGEDDRIAGLTANMSEVLNLKVYKVSKPNFIDGSTTTNLIGGDIFYQDEDDTSKIHKPVFDGENQTKSSNLTVSKPPSLLQNIRAYKYVSTRFRKDEKSLLQVVKENNQKFKMIKAGQSITEHIPHPTVDEVLQWAIEYVNSHEHHLASHFIHLEERIKCHIDERLVQNGRPSATLPSKNGDANNTRTNKQILATSTQNSDMMSKPKSLSLVQQLENMKIQGTEAFLKSVTTAAVESNSTTRKLDSNPKNLFSSKAASKKDGSTSFEPSKPQQSRKTNVNNIRYRGGTKLGAGVVEGSTMEIADGSSSLSCKEPASEINMEELQPVVEGNEVEVDEGDIFPTIDEAEQQPDAVPLQDIRISSRERDKEKDHADSSLRAPLPVTNSPLSKVSKKVSINTSSKPSKSTQGVKYSNAKIESPSPSNDGKINVATQEAIDDMKRTQMLFVKSLGYTMNIFKNANERQSFLENKTQKRLSKAHNNGNKLFSEFKSFQNAKLLSEQRVEHCLKDREFHRGEIFEAKGSIFMSSHINFAESGGNIHDDMKKLRQTAREYTETKHISIILEVKWFIAAVNYLRNYMRRMSNQAPPCCLKFLSILEQIIYMCFIVDASIFYKILLSDIFVRDDYRKNVVHQLIDVVREGLGIGPEDFVKFLEKNDLQVPPELMNLVRSNAQMAQKAVVSREKRERSPGMPKMGSISFSTDVVLINEPELILHNVPTDVGVLQENRYSASLQYSILPSIISEPSQNKRDGLIITSEDV